MIIQAQDSGRRGVPFGGSLVLAFAVAAAAGCRTTITVEEDDWTVERAVETIRRYEEVKMDLNEVLDLHQGLHERRNWRAPRPAGECTSSGFANNHIVRYDPVERKSSVAGEVGEVALLGLWVVTLPVNQRGGGPPDPWEKECTPVFETRWIEFADIERVVLDHNWYPLLALTVMYGPWVCDVELEMKDGRRIEVARGCLDWTNLFPIWLYPGVWNRGGMAREYAGAIESLRIRAAREAGGR